MRIWLPVLAIAAAAASAAPAPARQAPDAGALLAAARQALGGDAALDAVTAFTVTGSQTVRLPPVTTTSSVDIRCALPDRFVRITRRSASSGPLGTFQITDYRGFNGDEPIFDTVAPDAPMPVVIPAGPEPRTPAEVAAARQRRLAGQKRAFVQVVLPLFAASPAALPLTFTAAGRATLPSGEADAIDAAAADGMTWRLYLDATTHLPVRLAWKGRPIVTTSTTSTVRVGPGAGAPPPPPPALPAGDPTAGLPDVDWAIDLADYRAVEGRNWPRRWRTSADGREIEDLRLGAFRINPPIDPRSFEVRRSRGLAAGRLITLD